MRNEKNFAKTLTKNIIKLNMILIFFGEKII